MKSCDEVTLGPLLAIHASLARSYILIHHRVHHVLDARMVCRRQVAELAKCRSRRVATWRIQSRDAFRNHLIRARANSELHSAIFSTCRHPERGLWATLAKHFATLKRGETHFEAQRRSTKAPWCENRSAMGHLVGAAATNAPACTHVTPTSSSSSQLENVLRSTSSLLPSHHHHPPSIPPPLTPPPPNCSQHASLRHSS